MSLLMAMLAKAKYIKLMNEHIKNNSSEFMKVYNEYRQFCFENKLEDNYSARVPDSFFILPFEVNLSYDFEALRPVISRLKENKMISLSEAKLILDGVVASARSIIAGSNPAVLKTSLVGQSSFASSLALIPFEEIGIKTTINSLTCFDKKLGNHFFGIVTLPILEGQTLNNKHFLIDLTYAQFCKVTNASLGASYGDTRPAAGYYACQSSSGKWLIKSLLEKGYILLDENIAQLYGSTFMASLNGDLDSKDGWYYLSRMLESKLSIPYTRENIDDGYALVKFDSNRAKL